MATKFELTRLKTEIEVKTIGLNYVVRPVLNYIRPELLISVVLES